MKGSWAAKEGEGEGEVRGETWRLAYGSGMVGSCRNSLLLLH